MTSGTDILIFIEDPGAANCVMGLPNVLQELGLNASIFASETGAQYLKQKGIDFQHLPEKPSPQVLLDQHSPKLILIGTSENPDTFGLQLLAPAQDSGIPTVGIVDGPANPQHRFRGQGASPLEYVPDWLIVPTDSLKETYVEFGHPEDRVFAGGHPYYDKIREKRIALQKIGQTKIRQRTLPGASEDQPIIVFAAETSTGLDPIQFRQSANYSLEGWSGSDLRTNIVLEEMLYSLKHLTPKPKVVLRLHPKNSRAEFSDYMAEIDYISETGSPLDICFAADLVVGMTSNLLVEAAILGCPTLSIIPREIEKEWLDSIDLGLTRVATSRQEIDQEIEYFMREWPNKCNDEKAMKHLDNVINFGSTDRISNFLYERVSGKRV
jgi:hypothetical protein